MSTSKVIGAALNSVTSLFNNSCDVNTVKFHQGRKTIMLARCFSLSQHTVSHVTLLVKFMGGSAFF